MAKAINNANSADSTILQLQDAAELLAISQCTLIVWTPVLCGLQGIEMAHHQTYLGANATYVDK